MDGEKVKKNPLVSANHHKAAGPYRMGGGEPLQVDGRQTDPRPAISPLAPGPSPGPASANGPSVVASAVPPRIGQAAESPAGSAGGPRPRVNSAPGGSGQNLLYDRWKLKREKVRVIFDKNYLLSLHCCKKKTLVLLKLQATRKSCPRSSTQK